ncbi:MAG: tetratricopeptide repeat protein [Limnochordaceae bacterium]|nr:tetratricopeptide repeat protein [Limnochordaceae bacterium]
MESAGRVEEAIQLLSRATDADPSWFEAKLRLGELLLMRGEVRRAIETLDAAAALRPHDPRVDRALEQAKLRAAAHGP